MSSGRRRSVTRGYVWGLIFAVAITAFALMLLIWSGISLATGRAPVETPGVSFGSAPLAILICFLPMIWALWTQSVMLLKGDRSLPWTQLLLASLGGYLIWCLTGMLTGLSAAETWTSPYALAIALAWAIASLLCWAVLTRRVYTEREVPRWPWEDREDLGPDWANTDEDPWSDPDAGTPGEEK